MELKPFIETLEGEHLKTLAEFGLHSLSKFQFNELVYNFVRGGERIQDSRLQTKVAGMDFENPLIVAAGWDKKGWAVDGLYALGFAGTEVGTVLPAGQYGNPKPRLFYEDGKGLNRMGFNSQGVERVEYYLATQKRQGKVGISLGKNKILPDAYAAWSHACVAEKLHAYGDYFVINVASPNTPGLRNLLKREPLTDIIRATQEVLNNMGKKPLFVKTTVDLALEDLDIVLDVCVNEGAAGVIDSNTTIEESIKRKYGWKGQMGGVSGSDPDFRRKCTERMKYITRITRGTGLQRMGVGAINDTDAAIERLQAGAQLLQVFTGIRESKGSIARDINVGLVERMERDGVKSIEEYVGIAA